MAINSALSPLVTAWVRHSSRRALQEGARPVPPQVRSVLARYFDEALLDKVRWTTSGDRLSVDSAIAHLAPRYAAMTMDRVIVFRDPAQAADIELWIHEMLHVEQIERAGGLARFIRAYLARWPQVEADTIERTNLILADLDAPVRQGPPSLSRGCT